MSDEIVNSFFNGNYGKLNFRDDAPFTCDFGLAEGFREVKGRLVFDTVRIHTGVDRGSTPAEIYSPVDFNYAIYNDYGKDHVYGSILRLISETYNFELRIMHIYPDDLNSSVRRLVNLKKPIPMGTKLGKAGDYGLSSGKHTHTELVSFGDEKSNVLEAIIFHKDQSKTYSSYLSSDVIKFYRTMPYWMGKTNEEIMEDWKAQKEKRRVQTVINDYKFDFTDWFSGYEVRTRYSTEKVLGI
jgi:hypothetical protein